MAFLNVKLTKFITEYRVMGNYVADVWEEEHATHDYADAMQVYQDSQASHAPGQYRIDHVKVPNPYYGRFKVGMKVHTYPGTDEHVQGLKYGYVKLVGREYVTIAWVTNTRIVRKFWPRDLEPLDEME